MLLQVSRLFRQVHPHRESQLGVPEEEPFLHKQHGCSTPASDSSDLERGILSGEEPRSKLCSESCHAEDGHLFRNDQDFCTKQTKWRKRDGAAALLSLITGGRTATFVFGGEKVTSVPRRSALRKIFRLILLSFMILGILHFIAIICGIYLAFFPEEIPWPDTSSYLRSQYSHDLGHWPTDITADIHPVACASHNDYWRKEPLFSALHAGCTGVEADVWLFEENLFVGHSTASLTAQRTLQSLYINPLLEILDKQNPQHSFHPSLDTPRNGVFDTNPKQNLVLLIDFKNNGEEIWPYVYEQLQPLREKQYLTYFDGTDMVEGPITVVATGNAPYNRVVENPKYRDIFFDAPLDLMDKASSSTDVSEIAAQDDAASPQDSGQGHSGAAPRDPDAYSIQNSYYASVSFKRSILGFPTLWRNTLSDAQMSIIRAQIAGAHARGLKVRYWSVPEWPVSMRNYLWRVLVREGVDYLNVDDLKSATTGQWGKGVWGKETGWWFRKR